MTTASEARTVFDRLQSLPHYAQYFDLPVVEAQHYAQSRDDQHPTLWLTAKGQDYLQGFVPAGIGPIVLEGQDPASVVVDKSWGNRLQDYLEAHRRAWRDGQEKFPGLLVLYQMGVDHVEHEHGIANGREFFTEVTDSIVRDVVAKLKEIEQFYNKVFLSTADHGHTEIEREPPCPGLCEHSREEALEWANPHNHNMHARELAYLFFLMHEVSRDPVTNEPTIPDLRLLLRHEDPTPEHNLERLESADMVAALNGPMAHIYVRNVEIAPPGSPFGASVIQRNAWSLPPESELVSTVADGIIAGFGGQPATFLNDDDFNSTVSANLRLANLAKSVDFLLIKTTGGYKVRSHPGEMLDVADLSGSVYVKAPLRVALLAQEADAAGAGSGDIIIVFRDRTDDPKNERYVSGGNIESWHGSLNRSDSYVPFIPAYPGGNAGELAPTVAVVCGTTDGTCAGNWLLTPLVEELIHRQLAGG